MKTSHLGSLLQGIYKISATVVNGKPSWTSKSKAIWYIREKKHWLIGNLDDLGDNLAFIFAINEYSGLDDQRNEWKYWDGRGWKSAKDINVQCLGNFTILSLLGL